MKSNEQSMIACSLLMYILIHYYHMFITVVDSRIDEDQRVCWSGDFFGSQVSQNTDAFQSKEQGQQDRSAKIRAASSSRVYMIAPKIIYAEKHPKRLLNALTPPPEYPSPKPLEVFDC